MPVIGCPPTKRVPGAHRSTASRTGSLTLVTSVSRQSGASFPTTASTSSMLVSGTATTTSASASAARRTAAATSALTS